MAHIMHLNLVICREITSRSPGHSSIQISTIYWDLEKFFGLFLLWNSYFNHHLETHQSTLNNLLRFSLVSKVAFSSQIDLKWIDEDKLHLNAKKLHFFAIVKFLVVTSTEWKKILKLNLFHHTNVISNLMFKLCTWWSRGIQHISHYMIAVPKHPKYPQCHNGYIFEMDLSVFQ